MYLSVTREPGKLRAMAGAPLRRQSDSRGCTYYNESWPELSETDPVDDREEPISYDLDYRNPERRYMENAVKAIRALSCADPDILDLTEVDGPGPDGGGRHGLPHRPQDDAESPAGGPSPVPRGHPVLAAPAGERVVPVPPRSR